MIKVIPSIDILNGDVVRLNKGDYAQAQIYKNAPLELAKAYQIAGASEIHLVNLDGAKSCKSLISENFYSALNDITANTLLNIEIGGGIKDFDTAKELLKNGNINISVGSMLVDDFEKAIELANSYPGRVSFDIAVDENDFIKIKGWQENTQRPWHNLLLNINNYCKQKIKIVLTSIQKDGSQAGPDFELYKRVTAFAKSESLNNISICASGGISSLEDIKMLEEIGIDSCIVGKMLYDLDNEQLAKLFEGNIHRTILIPKGRLYDNVKDYMQNNYGIVLPDKDTRKYYYKNYANNLDIYIAKPKAIPQLMHAGFADFGFCGEDIVKNSEYADEFEIVDNLHKNTIKICLCSRLTMDELLNLKRPIIVATEFTTIASKYFTNEHSHTHYIIDSAGSTEGYPDFCADCIIDVVETGRSLEANKLNIIDTLFESSTCLFRKI